MKLSNNEDYKKFFKKVKRELQSSQIKAALSVNSELIRFYWWLGEHISMVQKEKGWGSSVIENLATDLKREFPDSRGFSRTNIFYIRKLYLFYSKQVTKVQRIVGLLTMSPQKIPQLVGHFSDEEFIQQLISLIPWGQNLEVVSRCNSVEEALFYVIKTIENNWSRPVLNHQIELNLYNRQGKSINNFELTLPAPQSDLARDTLKDPYKFDFISLSEKAHERDLENALTTHIIEFLLELGQGFSFVGRQYQLTIDKDDFYIDLLFYHYKLRCFVVVELKTDKFKPEYAGKLNFYLSAVDAIIKQEQDQPTIGILLCKSKSNLTVEYALKDLNKPIGVSEYKLLTSIPEDLKTSLPTIEELESELSIDLNTEG